uniref:(California timema) hypothetical protein n=1 Tax=Timema californicum TaxID=61474 RepID=A0A7R9J5P3_TIMCA|nr:unnamed protein product [Timema californicum]
MGGKHLGELGILPEDTRDDLGRGRFHGFNLNKLLFPGGISSLSSYYKKSVFPVPQGPECCSEHSITFNGIESDKLYTYDYFLYHTKVFRHGGSLGNQPASTPCGGKFIRDEGLGEANLSARQFFELWERKVSSPDEFNRKVRQEYLHEETPSGAAFFHMPDVLHSMLSSMQGNISENVV